MRIFLLLIVILSYGLLTVYCCSWETRMSGNINLNSGECRNIFVPEGHFASIKITQFTRTDACNYYIKTTVHQTYENHKICSNNFQNSRVTSFKNVSVSAGTTYYSFRANFEYKIKELACADPTSFQCDDYSCVPKKQRCDRIKQCRNGIDEIGCETGMLAVDGIEASRKSAVSWLLSQRQPSWGWKENTPRAVVALYLASAANYNGTNMEEEVMAQQVEVKIATSLLRSTLKNSELSMFVNALLVTCHNPRQFYGHDLVQRLKSQVEETIGFVHPLSYLALCNANETWPEKAVADLTDVLESDSAQPFVQDLHAMAHLALSCAVNNSATSLDLNTVNFYTNFTTITPLDLNATNLFTNLTTKVDLNSTNLYTHFTSYFKNLQNKDGSFGNIYSTALVTQALLASGQEKSKDWNLNKTAEYLIKQLNSSSVDFLFTYLTLPALNGKTLADIWRRDCSENPRKEDPMAEIVDYLGDKVRVKYSLYIGDERDIVHTISLRVPQNYTAFQVMEWAEREDSKFRFAWRDMAGKKYIYEIANLTNDPEHGEFWLLFVSSRKDSDMEQHAEGPDNVILQENDHLILWYKTATI